MQDQDLITITLPVTGRPDCPDWHGGRKVTVIPKTHQSVHQAAGKHLPEPGPDSMCVTFTTA